MARKKMSVTQILRESGALNKQGFQYFKLCSSCSRPRINLSRSEGAKLKVRSIRFVSIRLVFLLFC